MRIQLVSTYFAPEHTGNAPYVTGLAEHLAQSHEVTVIAGWPHYPKWQVAPEWRHWRQVETQDNLTVVRLAHYVPKVQDSARRALYEASWAAHALAEGVRHRADVVIGVVPTLLTTFASVGIARRHRAPLGIVVQDIVSRAAEHSGIKGGQAAAGLAAKIERSGLQRTQRVATIHPRFADVLSSEYGVPRSNIDVIYNWSHIGEVTQARSATRRELGWSDEELVVLHSGNMGHKQHLDNVVAAGKLARGRKIPIRFVLAGDGNQRAHIERVSAGVATVEVRDAVSSTSFADFLAAADVLLINEREAVFEMSVPSKLTSYFAAGRPIVAATEYASATAELIRSAQGGLICEPNDPGALLDAIDRVAGDEDLASRYGANGSAFASDELSQSAALERYDRWVERVAAT